MVYLEKINILSWQCNEVGGEVNLCLLSCKVRDLPMFELVNFTPVGKTSSPQSKQEGQGVE